MISYEISLSQIFVRAPSSSFVRKRFKISLLRLSKTTVEQQMVIPASMTRFGEILQLWKILICVWAIFGWLTYQLAKF